jgi:4-amino-4-deoxy-L-arabinose transferase-like glycosyltransferase
MIDFRVERQHRITARVIFGLVLLALILGARTQGNVRDEGYYFEAAELYGSWYGELAENIVKMDPRASFTKKSVDRGFSYNHEHPALMKSLSGISWRLFHKCDCPNQRGRHPFVYTKKHLTLPLLDEEAALRLPTQILVALMAAIIYVFGATAWSRTAGVTAAILSVAAPRLFFDAQLATFDAPVAALWVVVIYAYWRALMLQRWGWRVGVIWGLALACKLNAFFIPAVLLPHWLFTWWARGRRPPMRPFIYMGTLGVAVFFACWPWLWYDTVHRFGEYVAFHVHHVYYNMEYLGVNYNKPPSPLSFPYVMTALTLPVTTLVLALAGGGLLIANWIRTRKAGVERDPSTRATGLLIGLNAIFPMAVLTITRAPIFGATKHWHASIPFLALLAGYAISSLLAAIGRARGSGGAAVWPGSRAFAVALVVLACAPAVAETWRAHPYALTHYNLLAGGPAGGADLGMNRQFWGYATRGLLPWINEHARPGAPIYWHDTNQFQLNMYVRTGRLRPDIGNTGLEEPGVRASDIALVIHEKHFNKYEYWIWDFYGTARPTIVLDDEGVPLVTLYERPHK